MELNMGMDGNIVVVDITGDLVASTAEQLKAQVQKLMEKNFVYVVLEMSKINFMDSSGLGACMSVHKSLVEKNGLLVCAKPSDPVAKVFRLTRADQKLKVVPTKQDGLNALHAKIIEKEKK